MKNKLIMVLQNIIGYNSEVELMALVLASFLITLISIPIIIKLSIRFDLLDKPNDRKVHKNAVPTLGGLGIYMGFLFTAVFWLTKDHSLISLAFLISTFILFLTGIVDDLKELSALRKLLVQLLTASFVVASGVRVESLYGFLGVYEMALPIQYVFSILLIVGVTNAFNLIDGIDGLAGGLSFINAIVLGTILWMGGDIAFALVSFSLAGSLLGFLRYNFNPAKIFMGDTGSLIIGFITAVLSIKAIALGNGGAVLLPNPASLIVVIGILLIPVYDTFRVAILRISKGVSPFKPDKSHIHHLLIETGFKHKKSAIILYLANLTLIFAAFQLCENKLVYALPILMILTVFLTEMLTIRRLFLNRINRKLLFSKVKSLKMENRFLTRKLEQMVR
jgi:UDP-GlcNAc:undecaprenyl-phosphate/decaprenyl-phosphate GlcNAc-1-phosphate transferase